MRIYVVTLLFFSPFIHKLYWWTHYYCFFVFLCVFGFINLFIHLELVVVTIITVEYSDYTIILVRHLFFSCTISATFFPNPVLDVYRQFLGLHGLVCVLTCTVNCGTLYGQVCAFPNHVQSTEFTTGGLQSSCRNISRMISGNRMHLSSVLSVMAKAVNTKAPFRLRQELRWRYNAAKNSGAIPPLLLRESAASGAVITPASGR